ncbi:MAG: dTMP kinase [Clostridiales Family XIII bacterium]|jgi:dTMP kinase|nr:dTMP kinase [Clostridiales Family XIII bacterium]
MKNGLFITFEGLDASGKSTQIKCLSEFLVSVGYRPVVTREPGGTLIGEQIRAVILDTSNKGMDYVAEAMLYAAARAQLVAEIIRPALEDGRIVICDRFVDSSLAYQGYARKLGGMVDVINSFGVGECTPDITFLLKVSPETGEDRRNGKAPDRIESEDALYHAAVSRAYEEIERKNPQRLIGIDGGSGIREISIQIIERVNKELAARGL